MIRNVIITVLVISSFLLPLQLPAESHSCLEGTWHLDKEASQSSEPLLELQGLSWAIRKTLSTMPMTQTIRITGEQMRVNIRSSVISREDTFLLNNTWQEKEYPYTGRVRLRSLLQQDGAVHTTSRVTTEEGPGTMLTIRRCGQNGQVMYVDLYLTTETGKKVSVRRIFRRQM